MRAGRGQIERTGRGLTVLGYRVFPTFRRLLPENARRFRRRLRGMAAGYAARRLDWPRLDASVRAWIGHARHADTLGLRQAIFAGVCFTCA